MKLILVLTLALFIGPCPKKRQPPPPRPAPTPVNQPTVEPTPPITEPSPVATPSATPSASPSVQATPAPTPEISVVDYMPPILVGESITVSGSDLAAKIQAAQDDPKYTTVRIEGGGSITKPVILRKHTVFDLSTYSCDVNSQEAGIIQGMPITDYGCFLVADGVLVEGTWRPPQALTDYWTKGNGRNPNDPYLLAVQALTAGQLEGSGTTILEPTYVTGTGQGLPGEMPSIEIFQALGDTTNSHTDKTANIVVMGFHIKGRQKVYDGGIRSSILLGNCHKCAALYNYLEDTGSIGIIAGGSGLEKDNFANDVVITRNVFSGVAAANTATINAENAYVYENYHRRPGHHEPRFGGGVCGHDHETNSPADHTRNIWVYNNLYDYEGAAFQSAGSAVCAQDPYVGKKQALNNFNILNNVIIGGRGPGTEVNTRFMSNGVFLVGLRGFSVINNYVFRTGQNAIQAYNISGGLIQDNDWESTGGSGNVSFYAEGMSNTILKRNNYRDRPGLQINVAAGFIEVCGGEGNVYEANQSPGHVNLQPLKRCP